jgi:beta-N-acetylhexosaminidase
MGAITDYYTPGETAVRSVLAGVDMLLIPMDFYGSYNGLLNAVKSGEIPEERIDESVKRILTVKYHAGLIELE